MRGRDPFVALLLEVAGGFPRFDLIITSMRLGDMDATEFAGRIRSSGLYVPVYMLAFNNRDLTEVMGRDDIGVLDGVFLLPLLDVPLHLRVAVEAHEQLLKAGDYPVLDG